MRIEYPIYATLILAILCPPSYSIEYFIYMPNTIIPQSIINVPIYLSRPPAIISFSTSMKINETQSFKLTKTFSEVPLRIDNVDRYSLTTNIKIKLYSCKNSSRCLPNQSSKLLFEKTYKIPISIKTHLIIVSPSKSCYEPGEHMKINVFISRVNDLLNIPQSSNPSLVWEKDKFAVKNITYAKRNSSAQLVRIELYNERNKKVANWTLNPKNITSVIEYKLGNNALTGIWRIEYYFPGQFQKDYEEFKVSVKDKHSSIIESNMNISIKYQDDITINSKEIRFTLCASYTRIRSVKGTFSGTVCLNNVDEELINNRPCLKYAGTFNGWNKCVQIKSKTEKLDLKNATYAQQLNRLIISVNIIDDFSKKSQSFRYLGPILENSKYKIVFLSHHYFKSMLPYYGSIQTLMHNGKPFSNATVMIQCNTVNFLFNWGHISKHNSDQDGLINFTLSPPPNELSVITCDIEDSSSIEETYGTLNYYRPSITQTLEKWKSESTKNIQLKLLGRSISLKGTEELKFELQSNEVVSEDLVMLLVGNGQIIKSRYIGNKELPKKVCYNRDDNLGHYTCDRKKNQLACMKKWKGTNCLTPLCKGNCNYGICVHGHVCFCKYGWTGELCDKCVASKRCVNGYCIEGNDCVCRPGWIGSNCDIEGTEIQKKVKRKVVQRSATHLNAKNIEISPIYITNITWTIPLMITRVSILVYTVSKIPSSSKLFLNPDHIQLVSLEINETNLVKNLARDYVNCVNIHPRTTIEYLMDNLIPKDSSQASFQTALYNMIISDQCTMPFHNIDKITSTQVSSNIMTDFSQIEHFDFLNMIKLINLFPISSMKVVSRTCPMWKIIAAYNRINNRSTDRPEITTIKQQNFTNIVNKPKFCGCNAECGRYVFQDFQQIPQFEEPTIVSSICINTSQSADKLVFIKTQKIIINPTFLVTIATIKNLKVNEIHKQEITIFNKIKQDLEIEITTKTKSKCLGDLLPERTFVLVKAFQSATVIQDIKFNCSGVFQVFIVFKASKWSMIYPNLMEKESTPIVRTESVFYNIINGIYQLKTYDRQFCQDEIHNSSVELDFQNDIQSKTAVEFEITIQNSLETFMDYVRYIYNNPKIENIFTLTMKIYEMNLNKLLKNKKYVNQSLVNIKRMVQAESEILRNITRSLTLEYEVSLINLCADIPNLLFSVKRKFCKLIGQKIIMSKFNSKNCHYFDKKVDEAILVISLVLSKPTPFTFKIYKDKLIFIKSCFENSNKSKHSTSWNVYKDIFKKSEKNHSSVEKWINQKKGSLSLSELSLSYFMVKDKPKSESILSIIIKTILERISTKPKTISQIKIMFLLKIFKDFEERFQPNPIQDKNGQHSKFAISFQSWSKSDKLIFALPKLHACLNINVKASYYSPTITASQNKNNSLEIIVNQTETISADISLLFKEEIINYKSLTILLPTGWILVKRTLEPLLTQARLCNIVVHIEKDRFRIGFDFYLVLKDCKLKELTLRIVQYQNIINMREGFVVISKKDGQMFHTPFKILNSPSHSQSRDYPVKASSEKKSSYEAIDVYLFKGLHRNFETINITTNTRKISIDPALKIRISKHILKDSNRIMIKNKNGKSMETTLNGHLLWFLRNYYRILSPISKIISNILSMSSKDSDLSVPENISYCLSSKTKTLFTDYIYKSLCKNLTYPYLIKHIDFNKHKITLKSFSDNCNLNNSSLKNEFKMNLIIKKSPFQPCEMLRNVSKPSKSNLVIFSPRNLSEVSPPLTMNLNNDYLVIEFMNLFFEI